MPKSPSSRKSTSSNLPADMPKIKVPFPPNMTAEEFLRNRPLSRAYFRSPNSFFIYRQQFVKQLKLENYNDQMVKVSKWAGILWSKEPNNVKEYYKNIEKEIQKLLNEQFKNEQNNSYQIIRPRFIFEYPYNMDDNDNNDIGNPSINATDVENVADASPDWHYPTYSSDSDSPTIPTYDEAIPTYDETIPIYDEITPIYDDLSSNFFPPFASVPFASPMSSASPVSIASPILSTSPVSPVFPNYQFDFYDINENVGCNNFESFITIFDEMNHFDDFSSFF